MKTKILQFLLICNSIGLTTPSLGAEEVLFELKNGDTIRGELIKEESTKSKKILLHPILGRLEIDVDSIYENELPTDQKLWSGELLIGLDGNYSEYYKNSGFAIESELEYGGEKNSSNFEIEFNYGSEKDKGTGGRYECEEDDGPKNKRLPDRTGKRTKTRTGNWIGHGQKRCWRKTEV